MKSLKKRIERYIVPKLVVFIARCLDYTLSYKYEGMENLELAKSYKDHGGFAFGLFHNNALLGISGNKFMENSYALTSRSKDGDLVAGFAASFGIKSVRGSSNKGGKEALAEILEVTAKGGRVAFAVDGPTGPKHKVKPGIVYLSQKLSVPILPFSAISNNYWTLRKTWDQTRIPKPFSTVTVTYGKPFVVKDSESIEEMQLELEKKLKNLEPS